MKNKLVSLALIGALALAGCGRRQPSEELQNAKSILLPGNTKVLKVYLSPDGVSNGLEARYYDIDGDGRTVEDYVVLIANSQLPKSTLTNQIRVEGQRQSYGTIGASIMTTEDKLRIDSEYQGLLNNLSNKFSNFK